MGETAKTRIHVYVKDPEINTDVVFLVLNIIKYYYHHHLVCFLQIHMTLIQIYV
jgi:hypothetical protein